MTLQFVDTHQGYTESIAPHHVEVKMFLVCFFKQLPEMESLAPLLQFLAF